GGGEEALLLWGRRTRGCPGGAGEAGGPSPKVCSRPPSGREILPPRALRFSLPSVSGHLITSDATRAAKSGGDVSAWAETMRDRLGSERTKPYTVQRGPDFDFHEGDPRPFSARQGGAPQSVR